MRMGAHLNTLPAQSRGRNLREVGRQILVNIFQHQNEIQAAAYR